MPEIPHWAMKAAEGVFDALFLSPPRSPTARDIVVGNVAAMILAAHDAAEKDT